MRVVLDTNFLMIPGQFGVDVFTELERALPGKHELLVFSCIIDELEELSEGRSQDARAARIALELLKKKDVRVVKDSGPADRSIVRLAQEKDVVVATQDKLLQVKLRRMSVPIVTLKAKKYLEVEGYT